MHADATVVFDKTELAETVHEEADARPRCAYDVGQRFLRDLGYQGFRFAWLSKIRHQQQHSSQALFTGVEQLIDKIGLRARAPGQQELQKEV